MGFGPTKTPWLWDYQQSRFDRFIEAFETSTQRH
jgi:hypothetical protein